MKKSTMGFLTGVSVVTAGVLGLGAVSSWFTNWDTKTWFGRGGNNAVVQPENPDKPQPPIIDENTHNGGAIISDFENNGISVLSARLPRAAYAANGISEQVDTAYLLTATIEPAETFDKTVDWSVAWVDPESEWAADKTVTDYVTVTPTEDGALTANVVCLQAFGEQVKVIVTSRDKPSVKANCLCDYAKRISSFEVTMHQGHNPNNYFMRLSDSSLAYIPAKIEWQLNVTPIYTLGTVADSFKRSVYFMVSDYAVGSGGYHVERVEVPAGIGESGCFTLDSIANKIFTKSDGTPGTVGFYNWLKDYPVGKGQMTLTIQFTGNHSEYTWTKDFIINADLYKVSADSVTVDNPNIIF